MGTVSYVLRLCFICVDLFIYLNEKEFMLSSKFDLINFQLSLRVL